MFGKWKTVFESEAGGRPVKGETHSLDDYRVTTTQKYDCAPVCIDDGDSKTFIPPLAAGSKIEVDGETLDELEANLVSDADFSESEAKAIVAKF